MVLEKCQSLVKERERNGGNASSGCAGQKRSSRNHIYSSLVLRRYARGTSWNQIPDGMGFHQTKKNLFAFAKQVVTLFSRIYKALCKLVKSALGQSLLHGRWESSRELQPERLILRPANGCCTSLRSMRLPPVHVFDSGESHELGTEGLFMTSYVSDFFI